MNNINTLGLNNSQTLYIKRQVSLQNIAANKAEEKHQEELKNGAKRETYGLAILELMSEDEYKAWQKATQNMNESEKILAIQQLYPLADINKLKEKIGSKDENNPKNETKNVNINGIRAYSLNDNFVQRYKNAYASVQDRVDING